jgi:hypothetical protein
VLPRSMLLTLTAQKTSWAKLFVAPVFLQRFHLPWDLPLPSHVVGMRSLFCDRLACLSSVDAQVEALPSGPDHGE